MNEFFTTENIGLFSAGLLVVGVIKFISYYKAFNVEILKYIDSYEILLLFADNISVAATAILFLVPPYVFVIMPYLHSCVGVNCSFNELLRIYWFLMSFHVKYQVILFVVAIFFSFTRSKITNFERLTYIVLAFIIVLVMPLLTISLPILIGKVVDSNAIIVSMLILNFFIMIMLATYNEIFKVKKGYFSNTRIILDGQDVPNGAYYIGQVKSFVFFYNPISKQSITFKTDKIKEILYKPPFRNRNLLLSFWRRLKKRIL